MIRTTLKVAALRYALAPGQDIARIKRAIRDAARTGGDMVDADVVGGTTISVLISPGLPIVFESREVPEDDATGSAPTGRVDVDDFDF